MEIIEYVVINYRGREYIGGIYNIESNYTILHEYLDDIYILQGYEVTIIEKDTNCKIGDILVKSLFDIKPYCDKDARENNE